jgi:hypothetical protein
MFGVNKLRALSVLVTGRISLIPLPHKSGSFTVTTSIVPFLGSTLILLSLLHEITPQHSKLSRSTLYIRRNHTSS